MKQRADTPIEFRIGEIDVHDHRAFKALKRGDATPEQQALVLQVLVKKLAATHDLQYVPGNHDAGIFLSGRAFVGNQVLKLINTPIEEDKVKSNG